MSLINRLTALIAVILVAGAASAALVALPAQAADPAPAPAATPAPATDSAAAPAATPVPPPPVAEKTTEAVDNPYGLDALWRGGDFVARGTLIILVIMSMGTWYIMIVKVWEQSRLFAAGRSANKNFWTAGSIQESVGKLKPTSPFRYIAESGVSASEHHEGTLVEQIDLNTWVTMSMQ